MFGFFRFFWCVIVFVCCCCCLVFLGGCGGFCLIFVCCLFVVVVFVGFFVTFELVSFVDCYCSCVFDKTNQHPSTYREQIAKTNMQ